MECYYTVSSSILDPFRHYILASSQVENPSNFVKHSLEKLVTLANDPRNSDKIQRIRPAPFFFSNSFLKSSIFSSEDFPANLISSGLAFSCGRGGRSEPHITSTRLVVTAESEAPPFFLIFSDRARASARFNQSNDFARTAFQFLRAVMTVGSTPTTLLPSDCSAALSDVRKCRNEEREMMTILATSGHLRCLV